MPARVTGRARDEFENIVRQLEPEMRRLIAADAKRIMQAIEDLYKITFQLWQRTRFAGESEKSSTNKGGIPRVKWEEPIIDIDIRGRSVTASIILASTVVDAGDNAHQHWYRLDRGWGSTTADKNMVFPKRVSPATRRGDLHTKFPEYARNPDGKIAYTTIKAGDTRRGYEGNRWSDTIVEQLRLPPDLNDWRITKHGTTDPT